MVTTRPMAEIEQEFDSDVVEAVQRAAEAAGEGGSTPSSDGTDLKQPRGEGVNLDAPD